MFRGRGSRGSVLQRRAAPSSSTAQRKRKRQSGKKQCERGNKCPYRDEHQHAQEFAHDNEPIAASHSWGSGSAVGARSSSSSRQTRTGSIRSTGTTSGTTRLGTQQRQAGAIGGGKPIKSGSTRGAPSSRPRSRQRTTPSARALQMIREARLAALDKSSGSAFTTLQSVVLGLPTSGSDIPIVARLRNNSPSPTRSGTSDRVETSNRNAADPIVRTSLNSNTSVKKVAPTDIEVIELLDD